VRSHALAAVAATSEGVNVIIVNVSISSSSSSPSRSSSASRLWVGGAAIMLQPTSTAASRTLQFG
jgi:hypothetical protein